jgi:hypothetical protein
LEEAYQMPLTGQKKKSKATVETFAEEVPVVAPKKNPTPAGMLGERERVSYKAQLTDYDYVCKTTGVCPLEEFAAPAQAKCEPLQPPKYEYPLTDQDKEKFKKALQVALEQMESGPTPAKPPKTPEIDMAKVTGLVDSEVENYMKLKDFKSVPLDAKIIPDERLRDIPGKEPMPLTQAPLQQLSNFTQENKGWMNLLLFVAAGILLIFLLEQLFKLAMMMGLRRTVDAMEYILRERGASMAPMASVSGVQGTLSS